MMNRQTILYSHLQTFISNTVVVRVTLKSTSVLMGIWLVCSNNISCGYICQYFNGNDFERNTESICHISEIVTCSKSQRKTWKYDLIRKDYIPIGRDPSYDDFIRKATLLTNYSKNYFDRT